MALFGHIDDRQEHYGLLNQPPIRAVMHWLSEQTPDITPGENAIESTGIKYVVIEHAPVTPTMETFEAHNGVVDIHFCLAGAEEIQVVRRSDLATAKPYDEAADVELLHPSDTVDRTVLGMTPGRFAILMPSDAHLPFHFAGESSVKKIVVKLPIDRLSS